MLQNCLAEVAIKKLRRLRLGTRAARSTPMIKNVHRVKLVKKSGPYELGQEVKGQSPPTEKTVIPTGFNYL